MRGRFIQAGVIVLLLTSIPSESNGYRIDNVSSPYTVSNLQNGKPYYFLLVSCSSQGDNNLSSAVEAIPLSPLTLAPIVVGEFEKIHLSWEEIPGTDEFTVMRCETKGGPYTDYSGTIRANEFTDTGVEEAQGDYYKIRPAISVSVESTAGSGKTRSIPSLHESIISMYNTPSYTLRVYIEGNYAYLPSGPDLIILDITDRENPTEESTTSFSGYSMYFGNVSGDFLYASDMDYGLRIIDVTDRSNPTAAGSYNASGTETWDVEVSDGYAYIADTDGGLQVVDVTDPGNPQFVLQYETPG